MGTSRDGLDTVSGLLAVGAALAAGELVAAATGSGSSPYVAVGSTLVDHMPSGVREWAIETFGTSDKHALFIGMGVVIALFAAFVGPLEAEFAMRSTHRTGRAHGIADLTAYTTRINATNFALSNDDGSGSSRKPSSKARIAPSQSSSA